jgi:hypothetical protein
MTAASTVVSMVVLKDDMLAVGKVAMMVDYWAVDLVPLTVATMEYATAAKMVCLSAVSKDVRTVDGWDDY